MAVKLFPLPDPGEGLVEADVVTWRVKVGDVVSVNDIVVEIETAKSLVELPIPWAGTVVELLVPEGATVEVGTPIVSVDVVGSDRTEHLSAPGANGDSVPTGPGSSDDPGAERVANLVGYGPSGGSTTRRRRSGAPATGAPAVEAAPAGTAPAAAAVPLPSPADASLAETVAPRAPGDARRPLAKPPVRKFAKDHGVDLARVTPTGPDGIVTRADVQADLDAAQASGSTAGSARETSARSQGERETRIPIKGVRRATAAAMVDSAFTAPHVTEFVTVDVTRTLDLLDRLRADRAYSGVRLSPLLILSKVLLLAIRRNPGVNATWDEAAGEIVQKHYVNLGIAASTPRGLIVPNIKDADALSLLDLGRELETLVTTAREGRTPPADMAAGTITITNVGVFGVDNGTPIINPGEAAILCLGAIRKMPWVVTDESGADTIAVRQVTQLSLSFDHRLIDGDLGSRFLADIAALLEDPARALAWG